MFLIKLILFIFLAGIVVVIFTVARIWWSVRKMQQKLRQGAEGKRPQDTGRSSTTRQGDTITDTRDPERINRKIIDDDEGEYVDFVEEK